MKKLLFTILLFMFVTPVYANSVTLKTDDSNYKINDTISVEVNITSSKNLGVWGFELSYNKEHLKLKEEISESRFKNRVIDLARPNQKTSKHIFTFEALKEGTSELYISNFDAYDYDYNKLSFDFNSQSVKVYSQKTYELYKDNSFKSILVEDKEYNKSDNIVVYESDVALSLVPNSKYSEVTNSRVVSLKEGENKISFGIRNKFGEVRNHQITIIKRTKLENAIKESPFVINNNYIFGITRGLSYKDLVSKYKMPISNNTNTVIKTGSTLKFDNGSEVKAVVKGDVTGDGNIGLSDLLRVRRYLLGDTHILEGPYKLAADMNDSGDIGLSDLLRIRRAIIERG